MAAALSLDRRGWVGKQFIDQLLADTLLVGRERVSDHRLYLVFLPTGHILSDHPLHDIVLDVPFVDSMEPASEWLINMESSEVDRHVPLNERLWVIRSLSGDEP